MRFLIKIAVLLFFGLLAGYAYVTQGLNSKIAAVPSATSAKSRGESPHPPTWTATYLPADAPKKPIRRVNIKYKGFIVSEYRIAALISIDGAAVRPYNVGDNITSNIILDRINSDSLEIHYLVPREVIKVDRKALAAPIAVKSSGNFDSQDRKQGGAEEAEATPKRQVDVRFPEGVQAEGIEAIQEGQYLVDRELVNRQLSKGYVYKHARFKKAPTGGYTINEIARGSLFEKSGLQDGDIIDSVNDREINSLPDLLACYQQVNSQSYIRLTIKRHGKALKHYYFFQ